MANHKSAIKRIRQTEKRNARNRAAKSSIRTTVKKARTAAAAGEKEQAKQLFLEAEIALAKGASKGLLHTKNAARKISRLAKLVNAA
jgi:small subunit ribosomal protein S20